MTDFEYKLISVTHACVYDDKQPAPVPVEGKSWSQLSRKGLPECCLILKGSAINMELFARKT